MKMKKTLICLLLFTFLFMTGCGKEKVVITLDNFSNVLAENNFTVSDTTEQYTKQVDYILGSRLAFFDENLEMEMIDYDSVETAKKVQDSQVESFALLKSTGAHEDVEKGKNYYKYTLISNDRYMFSVRVDKTLVFCKTLLENKEKVENILDTLGY